MRMFWWMMGPLRDAAGDGGDGGGSGAGAGTGDGSKSGAVDLTALKSELLTEIRKDLNGIAKGLKTDITKLLGKGQDGSGAGSGSGSGSGSGGGSGSGDGDGSGSGDGKAKGDPALAAQLRALERSNKELLDRVTTLKTESDQTKAAAEQKEQHSIVRTKLSKFKFADESAAEDAFEIVAPKIKRNEDGQLVGPDGTPIDQYIEETMRAKTYLLAPKNVGGAGAQGGSGSSGKRSFTLDDIDNMKNLSVEDKAKLRHQIAEQLVAAQSGR